ncbi:hypothetical protein OG271_27130 [Micromonospora rifamycinica]|uniref:hypothetical protein n=1 Tax=Micromonospora rifamycinica TaxID=291594 RepID=UPI002E29897E|nr:hypothetical protein [Micromonospora rifamycinica]
MTNVQQPEMRRDGNNATVQDSKGPGVAGHPAHRSTSPGDRGRRTPRGQASPYGPDRPSADDHSDRG